MAVDFPMGLGGRSWSQLTVLLGALHMSCLEVRVARTDKCVEGQHLYSIYLD
jgi:hypothetical protein